MSNVTTEQKPPRSTNSPFGRFQVVGLLAAAMVALLVALPYVNGEKGSGPSDIVPAPSVGGGGGGSDPGGGPDATATPGATATPQSEGTPEPEATPTPTPAATSAAYDDCTAGGLTGCEPLREPGSAAAVAYELCRAEGRPPDECLVAATS